MIKEVAIIRGFDHYREAKDYAKTFLEDVVLLSIHDKNGKVLYGPMSKVNVQEVLDLFKEKANEPTTQT